MTTPTFDQLVAQVKKCSSELDRRAGKHRRLAAYDSETSTPLPRAIVKAKVTKAYRLLMPMASAPFGSLILESSRDALEVSSIEDTNKEAAQATWAGWQENFLDSESALAFHSTLLDGRAFALVWPDEETDKPEISFDAADQMIVLYREGSRHHREAAMRRWVDDDGQTHATLYRRDGIYKFSQAREGARSDREWAMRGSADDFFVENPWDVVPVVEIPINRKLVPGPWGHVRGDYSHCTGLIDRIHLLTFLGLVVAFWMGFPLRGVIGEKILRDDNDKPIPPFDVGADSLAQLENPEAEIFEYKAADRGGLSIYHELDQLAALTRTPRHAFPLEQGMSNLAADAIRATNGAAAAKTTGYKKTIGEGLEEVLRLYGRMLEKPVVLSPAAEIKWKDHEFRSLAERADAASKFKDVLPWQAVADVALNATQAQIDRWSSQRTGDAFGQLLAAANSSVPAPTE